MGEPESHAARTVSLLRRGAARDLGQGTSVWLLRGLILMGLLALLYYFGWWMQGGRFVSPWLVAALIVAAVYNWAQLVASWALYLAARRRAAPPPRPEGLTVDVFVTAYGEPYPLIEGTLTAACAMRGAHRTWLLDDAADPELAGLASRLGAGYLARPDRIHAKAGNINAALRRTEGDIVVIFDVDHAPQPEFLERTVGHFADPRVGFVQVMLTFRNDRESWFARAAAESTLDFYNPTSMGADGLGSATLIGSNALIRRKALTTIGGYRPGLAEDLATSIALHAAGWQSIYVAEPLAPGLAPPDLRAWFTQQLKWARGVFEVLLKDYPRLLPRLSWGQRLSYAVRMTYYWIGLVTAVHLVFTIAMLTQGSRVVRMDFQDYLGHAVPLALSAIFIRQAALATWRHPSMRATLLWRPIALVYSTWPIYVLAWGMALLGSSLGFRPTPKGPSGVLKPWWLLPQMIAVLLLAVGVFCAFVLGQEHQSAVLLTFSVLQGGPQLMLLWQWGRSRRQVVAAAES